VQGNGVQHMADEKYMLTREKYKKVKRYDHQQMENFCFSIYVDGKTKGYIEGQEDGRAEGYASGISAAPVLDVELLEETVLETIRKTKGIGTVKFQEIKKVLAPVFRQAIEKEKGGTEDAERRPGSEGRNID